MPYLMPRARLLSALLGLALPTTASSDAGDPASPVPVVTGIASPEDLVRLPGTPWVVISSMAGAGVAGRLMVTGVRGHAPVRELTYASQGGAAMTRALAPHGLAVRPLGGGRFELLVVEHGAREAILRMSVRAGAEPPVVDGVEVVPAPAGVSINSVAPLGADAFVATNMYDPRDRDFLAKFSDRRPTGGVLVWTPKAGWRPVGDARLSGANGIVVTPDQAAVIVTEWAARKVWRIPLAGGAVRTAEVDFLPDNLHWVEGGAVLLAGQEATPEALFGCVAVRCPMGYTVGLLDAESLVLRPLVRRTDGEARREGFGGATGALSVDGKVWAGSFNGDRIVALGNLP